MTRLDHRQDIRANLQMSDWIDVLKLKRVMITEPRVLPCAEDAQGSQLKVSKDLDMIAPLENGFLLRLERVGM